MNKEDILKKIDEAILTEEKAMPIYTKHIGNTLFWSGLSKETQNKIKDTFLKLKQESSKHINQLEAAKKLISETK